MLLDSLQGCKVLLGLCLAFPSAKDFKFKSKMDEDLHESFSFLLSISPLYLNPFTLLNFALSSDIMGAFGLGNVHGNLADYGFGRNMQDIITQIMNQSQQCVLFFKEESLF